MSASLPSPRQDYLMVRDIYWVVRAVYAKQVMFKYQGGTLLILDK